MICVLDADDIEAIKVMVPQLEHRDSVAQRMKDVGIKFEEVDHYGYLNYEPRCYR